MAIKILYRTLIESFNLLSSSFFCFRKNRERTDPEVPRLIMIPAFFVVEPIFYKKHALYLTLIAILWNGHSTILRWGDWGLERYNEYNQGQTVKKCPSRDSEPWLTSKPVPFLLHCYGSLAKSVLSWRVPTQRTHHVHSHLA